MRQFLFASIPSEITCRIQISPIQYPAFFEKRIRLRTRLWWTGRKQKYTEADVSAFFLVKKSFSPLPDSHLPLSETERF